MKEINSIEDDKGVVKDKRSNSIVKNVYNKSINIKINLLEMIKYIYRKGIINSEEKIKLKKLVIARSKKLENFYYNTYKSKEFDENNLKSKITILLN